MPSQYQSVGFSFEAYDKGLSSEIGDVVRGFRSIEDLLPSTNKMLDQSNSALRDMMSHASTSFGSLKQMMQPGALSTGYEDRITAMDKDLRRLGVNAGYSGKELSKFKGKAMGMSIGMKIGAEEAAEAVSVWQKSSAELKAVGIDSAQTLAKYANVSGMSAKDLGTSLASMRKEFQFADKDLNLVASSFLALGKSTGDVDGAMKDMPKTLELIRQKAQGFGVDLPTDKLAKFASQTAVLSGALAKVTGNASEARDIAFAFSNTMLKARTNFLDSFAGKGEFAEMFKSVGQGFGDIGVAMDSMNQGPAEFMAVMAKMVLTAKKNGQDIARPLAFVEARFREAFDPQQAAAMSAMFRNANEDVLTSLTTVQKGTAALGKYAKEGFTAGWTLSESFEHSKDVLEANFRKIGKSAATHFVKESGAAFKSFTNDLTAMAAKGGPVGALVTKMSEASHLGGLVFLPEKIRPMGALFGVVNEKMAPMIEQTSHLAQVVVPALTAGLIGLRAVLSPRGLLLTGALGLGTYLFSLTKAGTGVRHVLEGLEDTAFSVAEGFANMIDKIPNFIDEAGVVVNKFFDSLARTADSSQSTNRWGRVWTRLVDSGGRALDAMAGVVVNMAHGFWGHLTGAIDPAVDKTASGRLGGAIGDAIVWAWEWVEDSAPKVLDAASKFAGTMWDGLWGSLSGMGVPTESIDTAGAKIGKWVGDTASAAGKWVMSWAIANPGQASVLSFAVGGPAGPYLAAFLGGAAIGDAAEKWWTDDNFGAKLKARLDNAVSEASMTKEQISQIEDAGGDVQAAWTARFDGLSNAAQRGAQEVRKNMINSFSDYGGLVNPDAMMKSWWADVEASGGKEMERFAAFSLQASSDIDKRWRENATQQLGKWFFNLDDVSKQWNKKFGGDFATTMNEIKASLDDKTFYDKVKSLEGLEHLRVQFQYTEEEMAQNTDKVRATLQALVTTQRPVIDAFRQLKSTFYDQTPALETLDVALVATTMKMELMGRMTGAQWKSMSEGADKVANKLKEMADKNLGWLTSNKTSTTTKKTNFIESTEVDQKALKGNVDVIRKATSEVASNLDGPLRKSVEQVLEAAFNRAYANVDLGTKKFADAQTKQLSIMAQTIEDKIGGAWLKVLERTSLATQAVTDDVIFMQTRLKSAESLFDKIYALRQATDVKSSVGTGHDVEDRKFVATTMEGKILEATMWPDWYDDAKTTFEKLLVTLISSVNKIQSAPAQSVMTGAPTGSASQRELDKAAAKKGPYKPSSSGYK